MAVRLPRLRRPFDPPRSAHEKATPTVRHMKVVHGWTVFPHEENDSLALRSMHQVAHDHSRTGWLRKRAARKQPRRKNGRFA
jgi:hypothetical protein